MQSDEVVWQIINHGHCSYKAKMQRQNFCRNEHNVTGLCNRSSCPLANSRYATIREDAGKLYLCIKTIERSNTPKHLWQKIRLSPKYLRALEQVNQHLAHWPKFLVHKNKQRLTKITQYMIRMRRLALKPRVAITAVPTRLKKQEARKEVKALKAAQIEKSLEKELLSRLNQGTYGDIYNFPSMQYNRVLDKAAMPDGEEEVDVTGGAKREVAAEANRDDDLELDYNSDEEDVQYVEDLDESEDDMEDLGAHWGHGAENDEDEDDDEDDGDNDDDEDDDDDDASKGDDTGGEESASGSEGESIAAQRHKRSRGPAGAAAAVGGGRGAKRSRSSLPLSARRGRGVEIEREEERQTLPSSRATS